MLITDWISSKLNSLLVYSLVNISNSSLVTKLNWPSKLNLLIKIFRSLLVFGFSITFSSKRDLGIFWGSLFFWFKFSCCWRISPDFGAAAIAEWPNIKKDIKKYVIIFFIHLIKQPTVQLKSLFMRMYIKHWFIRINKALIINLQPAVCTWNTLNNYYKYFKIWEWNL